MAPRPSSFIRAMHPKTEIRPDAATIRRIMEQGWWGQVKIHGHRAQVHISCDHKEPIIAYNRQGKQHAKAVPDEVAQDLRHVFGPEVGWNVIDTEWIKSENRFLIFDFLKRENIVLDGKTYEERYTMLPRLYSSAFLDTLPVLTSVDLCMKVINNPGPRVEGIVLKARHTPGFQDTSIIRCRVSKRLY